MITAVDLKARFSADTRAAEEAFGRLDKRVTGIGKTSIAATIGLTALGESINQLGEDINRAVGGAVEEFLGWNQMLMELQNNTGSTSSVIREMGETVRDVASRTNAPIEQLNMGLEKIRDHGFNAADSAIILESAMKAASTTGSDTAEVAQLIATTLHQYHMSADQAAGVTDILMLSAQKTNATFEQFANKALIATSVAANLGVPINEVAAALSALERNGFQASEAQVQLKNMFTHMINPAAEARDEIKRLSDASGVDLVSAFSAQGLASLGLTGVMERLREAYKNVGLTEAQATQETMKLLNAQRGGLGTAILTGKAWGDYTNILAEYDDIMSGKISPTTEAYNIAMETTAFRLGILGNNAQIAAQKFGEGLEPTIRSITDILNRMVLTFNDMDPAIRQVIATIVAATGVTMSIIGPLLIITALLPLIQAGLVLLISPVGALIGVLTLLGIVLGVTAAAFVTNFNNAQILVSSIIDTLMMPSLNNLRSIFQDGIPQAIAIGRQAWDQILVPTLVFLGHIIGTVIIPIITQLVQWMGQNLPAVIQTLANFLNTLLFPALDRVGQVLVNNVVPFMLDLATQVLPLLNAAIAGFGLGLGNAIQILERVGSGLMSVITGPFQQFTSTVQQNTQLVTQAFEILAYVLVTKVLFSITAVVVDGFARLIGVLINISIAIWTYAIGPLIHLSVVILTQVIPKIAMLSFSLSVTLISALTRVNIVILTLIGNGLIAMARVILVQIVPAIGLWALTTLTRLVPALNMVIVRIVLGLMPQLAALTTIILTRLIPVVLGLALAMIAQLAPAIGSVIASLVVLIPTSIAAFIAWATGGAAISLSWGPVIVTILAVIAAFGLLVAVLAAIFPEVRRTVEGMVTFIGEQMGKLTEFVGGAATTIGNNFNGSLTTSLNAGQPAIAGEVTDVANILQSMGVSGFASNTGWGIGSAWSGNIVEAIRSKIPLIASQVAYIKTLLAGASYKDAYGGGSGLGPQDITEFNKALATDKQMQNFWQDPKRIRDDQRAEQNRRRREIAAENAAARAREIAAAPINFNPIPFDFNDFMGGYGGDGGAGGGKGGSGKGSGGGAKVKSAIEEAADMAKKIADAITTGVKSLQILSRTPIPTNIPEKARQFAGAVDAVMMEMQKVAMKYAFEVQVSEDTVLLGTEIIGNYGDAVGKMFGGLNAAFDLFERLTESGHRVLFGSTKLVTVTNALAEKVVIIMNTFGPMTAGWDELASTQVGQFSEAMEKAFSGFNKAFDFFMKIAESGNRVLFGSTQLVTVTNALAQKVVIIMNTLGPQIAGWDEFSSQQVQHFAEATEKVFSAFSKVFELFVLLAEKGQATLFGPVKLAEITTALSEKMVIIMNNLGARIASWTDPAWAKQVEGFASAAEKVFGSLKVVFDLFLILAEDGEKVIHGPARLASLSDAIAEKLVIVVNNLGARIAMWTDPQWAKQISDFADASAKVFPALKGAFELFVELAESGDRVLHGPAKLASLSDQLSEKLVIIVNNLGSRIKDWTNPDWAKQVQGFADASNSVMTSLNSAFDAMVKIAANKDIFPALDDLTVLAMELGSATVSISDSIRLVTAEWTESISKRVQDFGGAAGSVATALTNTLGLLIELAKNVDLLKQKGDLTSLGMDLASIMVGIADSVEVMTTRWTTDISGRVDGFAQAASNVMQGLNGVLELIIKMSEGFKLPSDKVFEDLTKVLVTAFTKFVDALANASITIDDKAKMSAENTSAIGSSMGTVVTNLGTILDFIIKLDEADESMNDKAKPLQFLGNFFSHLVSVLTKFKSESDVLKGLVSPTLVEVATMIGGIISPLSSVVDMITGLAESKTASKGKIEAFFNNVVLVLKEIPKMADSIGAEARKAAEDVGTKLGPAFDLLMKALDLFKGITGEVGEDGKRTGGLLNVDPNAIGELTGKLWLTIQFLKRDLLDLIAPELATLANEFANKIGPAIDVLHSALDFFLKLMPDSEGKGGLKPVDDDAIGEVVGSIWTMLMHWKALYQSGDFQDSDFGTRTEQFAATLRTVLDSVTQVVDLANAITEQAGKTEGGAGGIFSNMVEGLKTFVREIGGAMAGMISTDDTASFLGLWKTTFSETEMRAANENNIWYVFNHAFDQMFQHALVWKNQLMELVLTPFFSTLNSKFQSFTGIVDTWEGDWDRAATAVENSVTRMLNALNRLPGGGNVSLGDSGNNTPPPPDNRDPIRPSVIRDSIIVNGDITPITNDASHELLVNTRIAKNFHTPGALPKGV